MIKLSDYTKKIKIVSPTLVQKGRTLVPSNVTEQQEVFKSKESALQFCNDCKQIILNKKKISLKGKTVYIDRRSKIPVNEIKKFNKGIKITNIKKEAEYFFINLEIGDFYERMMEPDIVYYNSVEDLYYDENQPSSATEVNVISAHESTVPVITQYALALQYVKNLNPLQYICGNEIMTDDTFSRLHGLVKTSSDVGALTLVTSILPTYDIIKNLTKIGLLCRYLLRGVSDEVRLKDTSDDFDNALDKFSESKYGRYLIQTLMAGETESLSTYMFEPTSIYEEDDDNEDLTDNFCKYLVHLYRNGDPSDRHAVQLVLNDAVGASTGGVEGIEVIVH